LARKRPSAPSEECHVNLIPLGKVDSLAVSIVAANLHTVLGLNADALPPIGNPDFAFLPLRNQYSAGKIIKMLETVNGSAKFKIGIVQCDLCTPILKFVFGESQLGGQAAVISLHRLWHGDPSRTYLRAAKIGIHEAVHLLGIGHCRAADCLMDGSLSTEKLDAIPLRFCRACQYEVSRRLRHAFGGPEELGT